MPDSFGHVSRSISVNGFRVFETLLPARTRIKTHAHDTAQICFVLEGNYVETTADGERSLRPGWMHARTANVLHANIVGEDEDVLALLVAVDREVRPVTPRLSIADILGELRAELRRTDVVASTAIEGLSLLLLARLQREQFVKTGWLGDAASIIDRRWNESISLRMVASSVGVNPSTLAVAFRRAYGQSVGERIRALRIAGAKHDLAVTKMPIAEIAFRCGFHDQAHLTRVFRGATGQTPAVYRARYS
jgi:AraC family transcriptional regulator